MADLKLNFDFDIQDSISNIRRVQEALGGAEGSINDLKRVGKDLTVLTNPLKELEIIVRQLSESNRDASKEMALYKRVQADVNAVLTQYKESVRDVPAALRNVVNSQQFVLNSNKRTEQSYFSVSKVIAGLTQNARGLDSRLRELANAGKVDSDLFRKFEAESAKAKAELEQFIKVLKLQYPQGVTQARNAVDYLNIAQNKLKKQFEDITKVQERASGDRLKETINALRNEYSDLELQIRKARAAKEDDTKLTERYNVVAARVDKTLEGLTKEYQGNVNAIRQIQTAQGQLFYSSERVGTGFTSMSRSASRANNTLFELSRGIGDAGQFQFGLAAGFTAIGNNIPQVIERLSELRTETGSVKGVISGLAGSLTGVGGLLIAVNLAVAIVPTLARAFKDTGEEAEEAEGSISSLTNALKDLRTVGQDRFGLIDFANEISDLRAVEDQLNKLRELVTLNADFDPTPSLADSFSPFGAAYSQVVELEMETAKAKQRAAELREELGLANNITLDAVNKQIKSLEQDIANTNRQLSRFPDQVRALEQLDSLNNTFEAQRLVTGYRDLENQLELVGNAYNEFINSGADLSTQESLTVLKEYRDAISDIAQEIENVSQSPEIEPFNFGVNFEDVDPFLKELLDLAKNPGRQPDVPFNLIAEFDINEQILNQNIESITSQLNQALTGRNISLSRDLLSQLEQEYSDYVQTLEVLGLSEKELFDAKEEAKKRKAEETFRFIARLNRLELRQNALKFRNMQQTAQFAFSAISDFAEVSADASTEAQRRSFNVQKYARAGETVMNTIATVQRIAAQAGLFAKPAMIAASIAGAARVKAILQQKFNATNSSAVESGGSSFSEGFSFSSPEEDPQNQVSDTAVDNINQTRPFGRGVIAEVKMRGKDIYTVVKRVDREETAAGNSISRDRFS